MRPQSGVEFAGQTATALPKRKGGQTMPLSVEPAGLRGSTFMHRAANLWLRQAMRAWS